MTAGEARLVRRYESELGIVMHQVRLREGRLVEAGGAEPPRRPPAKAPRA